MTTIALVFDFDDILAPDSTSQLLESRGLDATEFWDEEFPARVREGYDPTIAYLSLLLDKTGAEDPLKELTETELEAFGETLDDELYPGLPGLFDDLDGIASEYEGISIEYYIISEGLDPIIRNTEIAERFEAIYASKLDTDEEGVLKRVKRPISFTDKTRYLFEINKGIDSEEAMKNPYKVNEKKGSDRAVPFENIVYVGDGITDIPCFSLVKERRGRVFGVLDGVEGSAKQQAIEELGSPRRTGSLNKPQYGENGRLGSLLRLTIEGMCVERAIDEMEAM